MGQFLEAFHSGQAVSAPFASLGLVSALIALSIIDLRTYRLPDLLTIPLMVVAVALNVWWGGMEQGARSAAAAVLGYGVIWLLSVYWQRRFGRDGIGLGDAKLLAAGGAWCGLLLLPVILLVSSALGLVLALIVWMLRGRENANLGKMQIPFGPFLAVGIGVGWCLVPRLA